MQNSSGKIALITGANKGIGFEVARQLGKAGFTVLVGARNLALGQQAARSLQDEGSNARAVEIDLTKPETIKTAAASIAADSGHLDVLVNNAGIVATGDGPPSAADIDAVEKTFQTNFLGQLRVVQAMLPLLRKSRSARIVNVSSGLGSLTFNSDPEWAYAAIKYIGYNASKAALNMLTVQLAYELRDTGIKVNSADPGYTATDLNGNSGHQTIEEGAAEIIRLSLLPEDGPTGKFSDSAGVHPW